MKKKNRQKLAGIAVLSLIGVTSGYFLIVDTIENAKESVHQIADAEIGQKVDEIQEASKIYNGIGYAMGDISANMSTDTEDKEEKPTEATVDYTRLEKVETPMYYYIRPANGTYPVKVALFGIVINKDTREEATEDLRVTLPKWSKINWEEAPKENQDTKSSVKSGYLIRDGVTVQEYLLRKGYATISSD